MTQAKPIVYILRGDNRQAIEGHIQTFYQSLGDPDMADMNTTRLSGKSTDLNDLKEAALAMPFLAPRRLVIIEDALKPFTRKETQAMFVDLLNSLPQSTALTLVIPDSRVYRRRQLRWEKLTGRHWLMQWVEKAGDRAIVVDCPLPTEREMPDWVRKKFKALGGSCTPIAANVLAEYVGQDTQRAVQEINKLLTYVNFERPVDADDVRWLTSQDHEGDIFAMVDAIGNRNGQQALEMLHILLEEDEPLRIFAMVLRQFRLLLQAREIIDLGGNKQDIAKKLKQHPFVAGKISQQAQHFTLPALEKIYHQLLEIDLAMKTGGMDGVLAMDILITTLTLE